MEYSKDQILKRNKISTMKQSILYIVLGVLIIIGGLRHNEHRLIPEFLYYILGGISLIFGIYKLLTNETDGKD